MCSWHKTVMVIPLYRLDSLIMPSHASLPSPIDSPQMLTLMASLMCVGPDSL